MNFYKRHLGDIAKATGHLSQGEMGAYDLLLDWCYSNEKPIPARKGDAYRIARATSKGERDNVDRVLNDFFVMVGDGFTQKRVLEEIDRANSQADTNRRIAEEREANKRSRKEHEPCNESFRDRSTKGKPSQTPDTRLEQEQEISNPDGLEVIVTDDVPPAVVHVNGTAKAERTPIQAIVSLYHESLPTCRRCEKITPARAGYIRQRWHEDLPTLDAWGNFFGYVSQSPFLVGKTQGSNGKPPFVADIEFLTKPASFTKIAEGKYHQ